VADALAVHVRHSRGNIKQNSHDGFPTLLELGSREIPLIHGRSQTTPIAVFLNVEKK
jgi:hypothetical protein